MVNSRPFSIQISGLVARALASHFPTLDTALMVLNGTVLQFKRTAGLLSDIADKLDSTFGSAQYIIYEGWFRVSQNLCRNCSALWQ